MFKCWLVMCAVSAITFVFLFFSEPFAMQFTLLLIMFTFFFIALSVLVRNIILKYLIIGIFSISLPLAILEGYFFFSLPKFEKSLSSGLVADPMPQSMLSKLNPHEQYSRRRAVRAMLAQNITLFDVVYTTNKWGKRITPYASNAKTAIVLLGCSFTFGDGLQDQETFAYKLGNLLGSKYQVFNLGVSGYGSHRVLAEIEAGFPYLKYYEKIQFYYVAIDDHVRRAAGVVSWDNNGPLYEVQDGKAVRVGTFADVLPLYRINTVRKWLERSYLYKKTHNLLEAAFSPFDTDEERFALQGALMRSMVDITKQDYPNSTFKVLLWPPRAAELFTPLLGDIEHYDIQKWFPDYENDIAKYVISYPEEVHPSAYANTIVAKELSKIILKTL